MILRGGNTLSSMTIAVDVASGLFALGGVALAGVWAEIRAGREARAQRSSELVSLKRDLKIRIVADTQLPGDAMDRVLTIYRTAIESNDRTLPQPRDERDAMIREFRKDLGRP